MQIPKTLADIQQMIRDEVQENIHLDYKDSRAVNRRARDEFAKDVSAFANSDGGVLVYGVQEEGQLPIRIDEGVDDNEISREWIESAITAGITPRIEDVRIVPISVSPGHSLYVIAVQKSLRGPHQASDKRYYKRHNFKSSPMEDYEVNDVRGRRQRQEPLVSFEAGFHRHFLAVFDIRNPGRATAEDVRFEFSEPLPWPGGKQMPSIFANGIRRLAPNQRLRIQFFSGPELLGEECGCPLEFSLQISYFHPAEGRRVLEEFPVNFEAYRDTMSLQSEAEADSKQVIENLKKLTNSIEKLTRTLAPLATLAGSTGLDLSFSTLRNLKRVQKQLDPEPIDPNRVGPSVFREVLGVDSEMAHKLFAAFRKQPQPASLADIPGMDGELLGRIRSHFLWRDERIPDTEDGKLG